MQPIDNPKNDRIISQHPTDTDERYQMLLLKVPVEFTSEVSQVSVGEGHICVVKFEGRLGLLGEQ